MCVYCMHLHFQSNYAGLSQSRWLLWKHAENARWKRMQKMHAENACRKRMQKTHAENARLKRMLKTHAENACWKRMLKTHAENASRNKAWELKATWKVPLLQKITFLIYYNDYRNVTSVLKQTRNLFNQILVNFIHLASQLKTLKNKSYRASVGGLCWQD